MAKLKNPFPDTIYVVQDPDEEFLYINDLDDCANATVVAQYKLEVVGMALQAPVVFSPGRK